MTSKIGSQKEVGQKCLILPYIEYYRSFDENAVYICKENAGSLKELVEMQNYLSRLIEKHQMKIMLDISNSANLIS